MTDVVWITLESVRQDHTSMGGHDRETTPNLLDLAADGVAYDECYSHDVWTRASTASVLTGRASPAHRAWSNEAALSRGNNDSARRIRGAGYHTVGISDNSQFSPETGLDAGFDEFHSVDRSSFAEPSNIKTPAGVRPRRGPELGLVGVGSAAELDRPPREPGREGPHRDIRFRSAVPLPPPQQHLPLVRPARQLADRVRGRPADPGRQGGPHRRRHV
jgi:arylsulfatase A-like enzyme